MAILNPPGVSRNQAIDIAGRYPLAGAARNAASTQLPRWRKAKGLMMANTRDANVLCIGDSNTQGQGGTAFGVGADRSRPLAYPSLLARYLNGLLSSASMGASSASICGTTGVSSLASYTSYDPRVTFGAGWVIGPDTAGGGFFENGASVDAMVFNPGVTWDTVDFTYVNFGPFTLDIGGATQSFSATNGPLTKGSATFTRGANTLNIKRTSGGTIFIDLVKVSDSTIRKINVINAGRGGWRASNWITAVNVYDPLPSAQAIDADLWIIKLGLNEIIQGVTPAVFKANMQTLITAGLLASDVLLVVSQTPDDSTYTYPWASYVTAMYELATTNSCPILDLTAKHGTYANVLANGFSTDAVHPTWYGYADEAQLLANFLSAA